MRDDELQRRLLAYAAEGGRPRRPAPSAAQIRRRARAATRRTVALVVVVFALSSGAAAWLTAPSEVRQTVTPPTSPPPPTSQSPTVTSRAASPTTTTTPTTTAAPTTTRPSSLIRLGSNGLGEIRFGAPEQATMALLTARLGRPDHDSGWLRTPVCPGGRTRAVRWNLLVVAFADGPTEYRPRGRHLVRWQLSKPGYLVLDQQQAPPRGSGVPNGIGLPTGIDVHSTVADLRAAFGPQRVRTAPGQEPALANGRLTISGAPGALSDLWGLLSDQRPTSTSTWVFLEAGARCGE